MSIFILIIIAVFFTIFGILLILSVDILKMFREVAMNTRGKDSKETTEYKGILRLLWVNKLLGWLTITLVSFCFIVIPLQAQTVKKPITSSTQGKINKSKPEQNKQFMAKLKKIVYIIVRDGSYSSGPSAEFRKALTSHMKNFRYSDVMATLFHLFKTTIEESNEDSRYFLQKLEEMNAIAEEQGELLKELNQKAIELEGTVSEDEYDESDESGPAAIEIEVEVREYTPVVENSLKISMSDLKLMSRLRKAINSRPGRKIIRSKRDAIVFKLNLKRQIARMNKLKEKLENSWRAYAKKLKRFQQGFPGITKRMAADAAGILK